MIQKNGVKFKNENYRLNFGIQRINFLTIETIYFVTCSCKVKIILLMFISKTGLFVFSIRKIAGKSFICEKSFLSGNMTLENRDNIWNHKFY